MTNLEAYHYIVEALQDKFEQRESMMISKALMQELFAIKDFNSEVVFLYRAQLVPVIHRVLDGEPLAYITGLSHFYGLIFHVNGHVLIPRPETEELVRTILEHHPHRGRQLDVLDIGVGSGCIGITLKKMRPPWRVSGLEWSMDALNVARNNAKRMKVLFPVFRVDFLDEAYWGNLGKYDIIVSNPPYVSTDDASFIDEHVKRYEPLEALFPDGDDALVFYKKITHFCKVHLNPTGSVYVEINEFLAAQTMALFEECFASVTLVMDMSDKPRIIVASQYLNQ